MFKPTYNFIKSLGNFFILICFSLFLITTAHAVRQNLPDEKKINQLYSQIKIQNKRYERGISFWLEGEVKKARAEMEGARDDLQDAALECVRLNGCEPERFISALDRMLKKGNKAMLAQAGAQSIDNEEAMTDKTADGEIGLQSNDEAAVLTESTASTNTSPVLQIMPQSQRTTTLLNGQELSRIIQMNGPVKASLEEWLTWMRPFLLDAHENYQFMRHQMFPAYQDAGLPEALLFAFLAKESGGKVHAVSRAGASGPLQFMPSTGLRFGLGKDASGFDTRFDAGAAAKANAAYLNDQFAILNRDLELVLAAYNGGEGRLARLSNKGAKAFWEPSVYWAIPPETRDYVPMVLAAAWLYLHPKSYGLEFPVFDATPSSIQLSQMISLNELSICLGQVGNSRGWFRTLRNLNPRYDPNIRLNIGTQLQLPKIAADAYRVQCVNSNLAATAFDLHQANMPTVPAYAYKPVNSNKGSTSVTKSRSHLVRNGETLFAIARKYGCQAKIIAKNNKLKSPSYAIRKGQRLNLSQCKV